MNANQPAIVITSSVDTTPDWRRDIRLEHEGHAFRVIIELNECGGTNSSWFDENYIKIEKPDWAPRNGDFYELAREWEERDEAIWN